ncbi:hypothetical protein LJC11_00645 [Bacteroidales bacterium OttesenSCG-928-I21]|nr:hypothetical protein [Bacteroidales bacterium OttesenSCG-928-I21]
MGDHEIYNSYGRFNCRVTITELWKYAFEYEKGGEKYTNVNGTDFGPYDNVWSIILTESGKYDFQYTKNYTSYSNNNGEITKHDHLFSDTPNEIYSDNKTHSFLSDYTYPYVVIDGQRKGNSPAIHPAYNKERNSFVWNALEGQELVVYEYMLD